LFTVCPKCTLTLVVTTVDLRAGQGYVRCGRCANVFNALIALREGDPNAHKAAPSTPPAEPAMGAGVAFEPEPEPAPEPEAELEPEPEPAADPEPEVEQPVPAEFEDLSMEFDDTATDVSEIFISPEHDTTSGSYEAVVLAEEPAAEPPAYVEPVEDQPSHTDTVAPGEWSLLDDDVPADSESVIEESPFAQEPEPEPVAEYEAAPEATQEAPVGDPTWVQDMFAEAEAQAMHSRTAEQRTLQIPVEEISDDGDEEPAVVRAARDVSGVSAASGDTVLEPLLEETPPGRPAWQYGTGIAALLLLLVLQVLHHNRQALVLSPSLGSLASTVYGWFGATVTPRWDLNAYSVKQLGAEAEGGEGTRLRVRLSVQNDSDRVQPLPLLRLTLQDRYGNAVATRDLEPREYLPPRAAQQRLLEPDQRIDAELHVIDPGKAAIGFEIDACLRGDGGNIGCANDARRRSAG
jgi:predicted Zn finger-like uncharacterized protein